MKVMDVIQLLEKEGTWIRSDFKTRDHLLHGSEDAQIHTVGVLLGGDHAGDSGSRKA